MTQSVRFRGLVHDVIESNEDQDAGETGCGVIVHLDVHGLTEDPVSCFACISGEYEYQRKLRGASLVAIHSGTAMGQTLARPSLTRSER